mgnify:CR=1 FL=1
MFEKDLVIFAEWFDWYSDPEDIDDWLTCGKCGYKPKTWVFDNGRFAQCACAYSYSLYDKFNIEVESIGNLLRRTGGNASSYDRDALRKAWNEHVRHL